MSIKTFGKLTRKTRILFRYWRVSKSFILFYIQYFICNDGFLVRLSNYEKEEKANRASETTTQRGSTSELEYLRDEVAILSLQLKE
jgi:hypothetical protein